MMSNYITKQYLHDTVAGYIAVIAVMILMTSLITYKELGSFDKTELSYKDNISNPINQEWVNETVFNYGKNNVQMNFCYRYYDTLDDSGKEWFKQQLDK